MSYFRPVGLTGAIVPRDPHAARCYAAGRDIGYGAGYADGYAKGRADAERAGQDGPDDDRCSCGHPDCGAC